MEAEMPILCEVCLGANPYVRMEKLPFGSKPCHYSKQLYQPFRWRPLNGRFKTTVISPNVARERNLCQCCLNDMQFGLSVGVRDAMLTRNAVEPAAAVSYVGMSYHAQRAVQPYDESLSFADHMQNVVPTAQMEKYARKKHVLESQSRVAFRNLPKLCSFWLGGQCRRAVGGRCPFRPCNGTFVFPEIARDKDLHERLVAQLTELGPSALQTKLDKDIRDALKNSLKGNSTASIIKRVRGEDDLAVRTLARVLESKTVEPPADLSVCTLWVGGVPEGAAEHDLFSIFCVYGSIITINIVRASKCAFVQFAYRAMAEAAIAHLSQGIMVFGQLVSVNWAKPQEKVQMPSTLGSAVSEDSPTRKRRRGDYSANNDTIYPSMATNRLGSSKS